MYKNYIISLKDDKINELTKIVNNQSKKIDELLEQSKETNERLSDVEDILEETKIDLTTVQDKLDIAVEDRAIKPYDKNKINQIAILKSLEYTNRYYLTCGQKINVNRVIKRKEKTYINIDNINDVPNSIYLCGHIKKQFGSKVTAINRLFQLNTISEEVFIDEIHSLFDGRKYIDFNKKP
jgi:hypothetical protein